jgi:hypothetical protein
MKWGEITETQNGVRARASLFCIFFSSFKLLNFKFRYFNFIWKKIRRRSQYCTLSLCKFLEQNTLYFGLCKNDKISQKDQIKFPVTVHGLQNFNLSFLLSPKYNIFWFQNLHTYRIQHYLHHDIFSKNLETSKFKISKVQNLATMEPELQMAALDEINPYIGRQKRLRFRSTLITHYD